MFDALGDGADLGAEDRLLAPSGWSLVDGKLRFAEENQSVCEWACDPSGDDPRVYYKHHRASAWADEHIDLSTFLLRFSIVEIILGAEHVESAPVLSDDKLARVIEPMRRLDLGDASWPELPTRLYARGDALAFVSPNGPGASTVYVGAADRDDITFLDALIDGDWD